MFGKTSTLPTWRLSREAWLLLVICTADMLSSALLFNLRLATEANPLLAPVAAAGTLPFLLAKTATFVPAVLVADWYGARRPGFVRPLLRWTTWAYALIYAVGLAGALLLG